jgi:plastocyanin
MRPGVAGDAAVRGLVRFAGTAPQPQVMSMAANAHCAAHHKGQVIDESVLVNADGTLRNVVVWVSGGLEGRRFAPPKEPAVLDQQGCVYTPHVVTVMAGQRLLVKNSDPFLHNVRAAAEANPPFNFGQPTADDRGRPLVFLSPERMFVKCDIHPWMSAYVHVLDNPFFAVTGADGSFALPDLPEGRYTGVGVARGLRRAAPAGHGGAGQAPGAGVHVPPDAASPGRGPQRRRGRVLRRRRNTDRRRGGDVRRIPITRCAQRLHAPSPRYAGERRGGARVDPAAPDEFMPAPAPESSPGALRLPPHLGELLLAKQQDLPRLGDDE